MDCIFEFSKNGMNMISYLKLNNEYGLDNPHNICLQSDMEPGETFTRYIKKIQHYQQIATHEVNRKGGSI